MQGQVRALPRSVTVRVPATTANLGSAFDCLGMALELWNTVRFEVGEKEEITVSGEGEDSLSRGEDNLVYRAARCLSQQLGHPLPSLRITCCNGIPLARGLGSSAAAAVGGLLAANWLWGEPLSQGQLLELAYQLEGHPDNVAPALLGGCVLVVRDGESLVTVQVPLAEELWAVLFIPDLPMATAQARAVLPKAIPLEDAVFNLGRAALLVRSLATGDGTHLRIATQDRLHQPAREQLFPPMSSIFRAALDAGALGVFLSGAGSTILALAKERQMTVGYEMADAAARWGMGGRIRVVRPSLQGAHLVTWE